MELYSTTASNWKNLLIQIGELGTDSAHYFQQKLYFGESPIELPFEDMIHFVVVNFTVKKYFFGFSFFIVLK